MRLSAEMYEQIVSGLKSDSHRDKDKRREPRVGMAGEAELVTVNEVGKRVAGTVRVRDVSRTGIGLFFSQPLSRHQRIVVQLQNADGQPLWLICSTAYCRQVDGSNYSVGAKIEQLMRNEQIQKVEARAAAAVSAVHVRPPPVYDMSDVARIAKAILD